MSRLVSLVTELLAGVILISVFTGFFAALAVGVSHFRARSFSGEDNPQYALFQSELERYRTISRGRILQEGDELDISTLNDGNWRMACLVGGYKDYAKVLNNRRAVDWKPNSSTSVSEFEMALVYIDTAGIPKAMHFRSGIGPDGQHFERCITKPGTRIPLFYS